MHSTPQPPESHEPAPPGTRTGYWRTDQLPDGTERHWSDPGRDYTETAEYRSQIAAAIDATTWYRRSAKVAFAPGALLGEIIGQIESRPFAFGVSDLALELPERDLPEHERHLLHQDPSLLPTDRFQTTSVVALAFREGRSVFLMYYLDMGTEALPVALDIRDTVRALLDRSIACGAGLHQACRGRFITKERDTRPCRCTCECITKAERPGSR